MKNSLIFAVLGLAVLSASCSSTHEDSGSSGSHWLTCEVDGDCTAVASGASCADDGYCLDETGMRIRVDHDAGPGQAGAGAVGAAASGAGGSGGSVALADCDERTIGSDCTIIDYQPTPECCDGNLHLVCRPMSCTGTDPAICPGVFEEAVQSGMCGGYVPCAGKACGESCDVCEPADPDCAQGDALFTCNRSGTCVVGMAECPAPEM